jgi:hypothetical protein
MNKTWRQSSIMASVLAQFIVDRTGQTAIDDGTTATLLANLKAAAAALNGDSTQTFSVAPATQSNQAVNLGQFASSFGTNSFQKLAGGLIIQGGLSTTITAGTLLTINYPLAFPNGVFSIVGSISSNATTAAAFVTTKSITNSQFGLALNSGTGSAYWIALGF